MTPGLETGSTPTILATCTAGQAVEVLEVARTAAGQTRGRTAGGWVSFQSGSGIVLLQPAPVPEARGSACSESGEELLVPVARASGPATDVSPATAPGAADPPAPGWHRCMAAAGVTPGLGRVVV